MKIKKIYTQYEISNQKLKIIAKVSEKGITLLTKDGHDRFLFKNSKPEVVREIGKLIVEAGNLWFEVWEEN
jgi:hypothetical protein